MLARVFAAGMPAQWVTGDSVYGNARQQWMGLEGRPQAYLLAVSGQEYVRLDGRQRHVKTLLASLLPQGRTRLSAGDGTKGPRWYDWRWLSLVEPPEPGWRRWLLVRRSLSVPTKLTAYMVFAPQDTTLAGTVQVAGTRWTIESGFEATKGEVGLDDYEVRSWTGWYRHITLAMWAYALLGRLVGGPYSCRGVKKKPAFRPEAERPGVLQGPAGPGVPLSVPEIRRLLWRLVLAVQQTVIQILAGPAGAGGINGSPHIITTNSVAPCLC